MFRYGDTWTPWRLCSGLLDSGKEKTLELDASSKEAISEIYGLSATDCNNEGDSTGRTYYLRGSTTSGRSWEFGWTILIVHIDTNYQVGPNMMAAKARAALPMQN